MGVRAQVAEHLTATLPDTWTVIGYGTELDTVTRPTVMVEQRTVAPGASAGLSAIGMDLTLVVPGDAPAKVQDDLEDALGVLLAALDPVPLTELLAQRGTHNNLSAYAVTFTVSARKEN